MSERITEEMMARDSEPDFIESLQGFASMCDSGAIDKHDGPMFARKFRDAAFVISMFQKLRDEHLAALSASPPAPAVAQDGVETKRIDEALETVFGDLSGFETRVDAVRALVAENAKLKKTISKTETERRDYRASCAEADANRLAEAIRPIGKNVYISDYDIPQDRSLLVKARHLKALLDALAEHDKLASS